MRYTGVEKLRKQVVADLFEADWGVLWYVWKEW